MLIELTDKPINPWPLVSDYESSHPQLSGKHGACVVFLGRMRDFNESETINSMQLEHYPGMTELYLEELVSGTIKQWDILDALVVHRVGRVEPADTIVLVASWAAHRAHAYEANQQIMEQLKSGAPFWKKETLAGGQTRWVEKNTPGKVDH